MNKRYGWIVLVAALAALVFGSALVFAQEATETPAAEPGYLGVRIAEDSAGARVVRVQPGTPAAAAGVQEGDIITAVNGAAVTFATLPDVIAGYAAGDTVTLDLLRDGETVQVEAVLAAASVPAGRGAGRGFGMGQMHFGVVLEESDGSVVIAEVVAGSPAEAAGLQAGDVVRSINGQAVSTLAEVEAALGMGRGARGGMLLEGITLEIERGGETLTIALEMGMFEGVPGGGMFGAGVLPDNVVVYDSFDQTWAVWALAEDSALTSAGLLAGDRIVTVDGSAYAGTALADYLAGLDDGATVSVQVLRAGALVTLDVPAAALHDALVAVHGMWGEGFFGPHGMDQGFRDGRGGNSDDDDRRGGRGSGASFEVPSTPLIGNAA